MSENKKEPYKPLVKKLIIPEVCKKREMNNAVCAV
jgi:hypothetical protein